MTKQETIVDDWKKARIDECFDIQQGKQVSKKNRCGDNQCPFLRTANVFWGNLDLSKLDEMNFTATEEHKYALRKGDLLVCEGGDIGRTAIWNGEVERCYYQNHLHRLRKKDNGVDENFVLLYLQYAFIHAKLYFGRANVTTIPNLSKSRLSELEIFLPPFVEQKSISRVFTIIQNAITAQELLIVKLKGLKRSMMHHLFTYGTKGEKTKMMEIGEIPESWKVVKLGDIVKISSGGTPSREKKQYWVEGTLSWVKTTEINYFRIKETAEKITELGLRNSSAKLFPRGTLLMAMYGQGITRGRVGILDIDATTNQACAALLGDPKINEYLFYYLTFIYKKIRKLGHGANQKNLNASLIKSIKVPVCSTKEMEVVIDAFKLLDEKINISQDKLAVYQCFFKTLLHKLMSGNIMVEI
jgi:type I restriction enzyme S subunit